MERKNLKPTLKKEQEENPNKDAIIKEESDTQKENEDAKKNESAEPDSKDKQEGASQLKKAKSIAAKKADKFLKSQNIDVKELKSFGKKSSKVPEEKFHSSQEWSPLEKSIGPVLKLKDGRYISIVEISPINFSTRTDANKEAVIQGYASWLKIAPKKLLFFITTEKTNTTCIVDGLKQKNEEESIVLVKDRREELINHVKLMSDTNTLSKHFHIVYEYEGDEDNNAISKDENEIYQSMMKTRMRMEAFLGAIGNEIVKHENEEVFATELLYKELNPRSSKTEPFTERVKRICTDHMLLNPENFDFSTIPEDNFVATRGYDLTHTGYAIKDGMYESYLYVKSKGFPSEVTYSWFEKFINFGEDVTVSLFAEKYNRQKAITALSQSAKIKRIKSDEAAGKTEEVGKLVSESQNDAVMKQYMTEGNEDLYDVTLLLTIRKDTLPKLRAKMSDIKVELRSKDIEVEDCTMHIEEAGRMSLPTLTIEKTIKERGRRNFLTSSLASTYMYSAYELFDENGTVLGINRNNSTIVAPDFFNTLRFPNANVIILGQTGMGKSYLLMTLAYSMRLSGKTVYAILPDKGHEWKELTHAIGGSFIDLAPASKDCINIMAIRPQKELDSNFSDAADEGSLLSKKIHQIITFIQLNMTRGEMTDEEEASLSTVLTQLYYAYGITSDNESIWEDKSKKIVKPMPIISDLYKLAQNDPILSERIVSILNPYVFGDCKNMNGQTNVDLENDFVIISTTRAGKKIAPFSFIAVSNSYDAIKGDRTEKCALIMDEVWKMMVNPYASEFVMEIYKIIRGYGGSAISATQDLEDLKKSVNGAGIINNAKTKFFLGMEENAIQTIEKIINLAPEDKQTIANLKRGNAMFMTGNDKMIINIKAPKEWHHLFDTDANTISKYKEKQKKAKLNQLNKEKSKNT